MPTIKLENVTKWYHGASPRRGGTGQREIAVRDVDLTIQQGEFVFIVGSNGAGKSTLLNLITSAEKPNHGKVFWDNRELSHVTHKSKSRARLLFGYVPQEPGLLRKLTVQDNLRIVARVGLRRLETENQLQARVSKVLGLVGVPGSELLYPAELTRGECRRVELARAMINSPPVLVLDELTANLDDGSSWDMLHLLQEINNKGTTVIMATNSGKYVNIMRKRVVTMTNGHILGDVQKGKYGDVI